MLFLLIAGNYIDVIICNWYMFMLGFMKNDQLVQKVKCTHTHTHTHTQTDRLAFVPAAK